MKLDGYDLFIYYYYFLVSNKDVYSKNYLMQKGIRQIKDYRKRIKKKNTNKQKGFKVSDYYKILVGNTFFGFPWKSIWKQKIPSRVAFFVWTAALGKCLMIDNL